MYLYLSRWSYDPGLSTYAPLSGAGWVGGLLDLRATGLGDGWCLLEYAEPLVDPPNGVFLIGDGWDYIPTRQESRQIESELGYVRDSLLGLTLREMAIIWRGPALPRKNGRSVLWVGSTKIRDEQTHEPRPSTKVYNESWPTFEQPFTGAGQDLDYTQTVMSGGWVVSNNALQPHPTRSGYAEIRVNNLVDTPDNYLSGIVGALFDDGGGSPYVGVGCRGGGAAGTSRTFYSVRYMLEMGFKFRQIFKTVDGSFTPLTSENIFAHGGVVPVYIEADGDQIHAVTGTVGTTLTDGSITAGNRAFIYSSTSPVGGTSFSFMPFEFGDLLQAVEHSRVIGSAEFSGSLDG